MRNFVFTSFDEKEPSFDDSFDYLIYQQEKCPKTNKVHWQGYAELARQTRFPTLKKKFPTWHMEKRKGTQKQAIAYCSKKETQIAPPKEHGEPKKQGRRTDIDCAKQYASEGRSVRDFIDDHASSFQSIRTIEKVLEYKEKPRDFKPVVFWLSGPTGIGKTRIASTIADFLGDVWFSGKNLKWWQGYDAHQSVILDDFRADFCTYHELLRILDRYPYTIELKGRSRQLLARYMFITCPYTADDIYPTHEDKRQLIRRIDFHLRL